MKSYLLKIRGGVEVDSLGKKAGKGPLIAEEISNTLGTSQDQYLFQPAAYGVVTKGNGDAFISKEKHTSLSTGGGQAGQGYPCVLLDDQGGSVMRVSNGDVSPTLRAQMNGHPPVIFKPVVLEHHPNDSRVRIDESGTVQTLTSRMGTGGGNVPMVMMPFSKSRRAKSSTDFETWREAQVSNTINTFDHGDVRATDVVVMATQRPNAEIMVNKCPTITASAGLGGTWKPVVCIQGNVIDRSDNAGANGAGWRLNQCYTLNTIDRPAVVYATGNGQADNMALSDKFGALDCMHDQKIVVLTMNERQMSMVTSENVANTLAATDYKGVQILAIDRAAFNQGENAKYDFQIDGGGTAQTLIARGPGAVCYRKPLCNGLQVGATATSDGGKINRGKTRE